MGDLVEVRRKSCIFINHNTSNEIQELAKEESKLL